MVSISNALAIQVCNLLVDSLDAGPAAGFLRVYSGTPPANVDAALSGNTQLAQLTFSDPAFGDAVDLNPGARATAATITSDASADATGTASFARLFDSSGVPKLQLTVSATGGAGELQFDTVAFVAGAQINITALTITVPEV